MNVTCRVAHSVAGRTRLHVPSMSSHPEVAGFLAALLLNQAGVTGVQVLKSSESIVIQYDPAKCTHVALVQALKTHQIAGPRGENEAPAAPSDASAQLPLFRDSQVAHEVPGRARFTVPAVRTHATHASALAYFLSQQTDVRTVRLSRHAESLIVTYDPVAWNAQALLTLIQGYQPESDALDRWQSEAYAENDAHDDSQAQHRQEVLLAAAALGISLAGGPAAAPIVMALLAISGQSIGRRAREAFFVQGRLSVDVLDGLALMVLSAQGLHWQMALLNLLISGGHWIRSRTQAEARNELDHALNHMVDENAWVKSGDHIISVPLSDVKEGDSVIVFAGERIPTDGVVLSGSALVDQHALTGESMSVEKTQHDTVMAGSVVSDGELVVRATRIGSNTEISRVVQMVREAPAFDTRVQDYAEKCANQLVPFSLMGAGVMALLGNFRAAASLLMIDYAAGFRIAAPTAVMTTMSRAAKQGILIRGGRHVEMLAKADAIVFDKTGTLTQGNPDLVHIGCIDTRFSEDEILSLAAGVAQHQTHPVARAIAKAARLRHLPIPDRDNIGYQIGAGSAARIQGRHVAIGTRQYLEGHDVRFSPESAHRLQEFEAHAISPVCVAIDGVLAGVFGLVDPICPEAAQVIFDLHKRGIRKVVMLTGDRAAVAQAVARRLGIDHVIAEASPADKLAVVKQLQKEGYTVAVAGDGINDSPALAQADVGIAIRGGTALAQETAGVALLSGNLTKIVEAIQIAREGMSLIQQNWDLIRIPNTVGMGLAFIGCFSPLLATLVSDGTALIAAANSLRPLFQGNGQRDDTGQAISGEHFSFTHTASGGAS